MIFYCTYIFLLTFRICSWSECEIMSSTVAASVFWFFHKNKFLSYEYAPGQNHVQTRNISTVELGAYSEAKKSTFLSLMVKNRSFRKAEIYNIGEHERTISRYRSGLGSSKTNEDHPPQRHRSGLGSSKTNEDHPLSRHKSGLGSSKTNEDHPLSK